MPEVEHWSLTNCTAGCSSLMSLEEPIVNTLSELFVPARVLNYGIYEFKRTVTAIEFPTSPISATTYVRIDPSGITANLVPLGTSMVTHGHQQRLIMNPGKYSVDSNTNSFNATVS